MASPGMEPNAYVNGKPLNEYLSEQKSQEVQEHRESEISEISSNLYRPPTGLTGPANGRSHEHTKKGRSVLDDQEFESWLRDRSRTYKETAERFGMTVAMVGYQVKKRGLARGARGSMHGPALAPVPELKSRTFGEFTIERGIALPPKNNPASKYDVIANLERDESVLFPDSRADLISGAAKKYQTKYPERKFATRKVEGGTRVWRTE